VDNYVQGSLHPLDPNLHPILLSIGNNKSPLPNWKKTSRISAVQGFVFLWLALLPFILPTQLQADDWDKQTNCTVVLWMRNPAPVDGLSHDNSIISSVS